jgi:flavin-dependent dehydrogenase
MYFGRHFRSRDGSLPAFAGVFSWDWDTISTLCLPADNGTWCLGLVIHSRDKALYGLRRLDRWETVLGKMGLVAHWLDGEPIDDGVSVLTRLEDRHRDLVVDGRPVVTGVVAVGDAWAATNPSLGRGASMGMMHALTLRQTIREAGLDRPGHFAECFHQGTAEVMEPWYRATLAQDRHRAARVDAGMRGDRFDTEETRGSLIESMFQLAPFDQDLLRPSLDIRLLLRHPDEVFASDPGLEARIRAVAEARPSASMSGLAPDRQELVALANA